VVYADKTLTCRECGTDFVFTAGEQEFYASKGLQNEPGRCPACRAARKSRLAANGGAVGEGGMPRAAREMHTAICAECGGQAIVPFLPRNDKPVYCSTCFERVRQTVM
jgi:CxxC-x17-CxxC domain-containing protein